MAFELSELIEKEMDSGGIFQDLVNAQFESYEHPDSHVLNLFFPIHGNEPEARSARLKDACIRQVADHENNPSSHWFKVVDTKTGEIAGGAQWHIFEQNPYSNTTPSDIKISWWPEGEERDFATALFRQLLTPRMTYMRKPHIRLSVCFTRPKYRRHGIGKLIMDWGIRKADEMESEAYIDASRLGALLYEKYDFIDPGWISIEAPENLHPSARWLELKEQWLPLELLPQWRPIKGKIDEVTKRPWDGVS